MPSLASGRLGASLAVWGATALLVAAWAAAGWWRNRRRKPPTRWRHVGELCELLLYPLKSGSAVALQEAECTELGLRTFPPVLRDRSFLVFNQTNGEFKTARQLPHMVLIKPHAKDERTVIFEAPGMEPLAVCVSEDPGKDTKTCTMWFEEKVIAVDCGEEAATWMSQYILQKESGLRLGYHMMPALLKRVASVPPWLQYRKAFSWLEDQDMGAFADITSYMLMTESSVAAVREKLPTHRVTTRQFRPNLVVRGSKPFEEDSWSWVKIGEDVVLKMAAPCTRCVMVSIDPETGVMDPKREPLKSLKTFRQMTGKKEREVIGDAPVLGVYMGMYSPGKLSIGDPVYVA